MVAYSGSLEVDREYRLEIEYRKVFGSHKRTLQAASSRWWEQIHENPRTKDDVSKWNFGIAQRAVGPLSLAAPFF